MAIIPLTAIDVQSSGSTITYTSPLTTTDTYTILCDPRVFLHFKKSGAGACTVTVVTPMSIDGLAVLDAAAGVSASGGETMMGPFRRELFADPLTGLVSFTLSEITGLSVAVIRSQ